MPPLGELCNFLLPFFVLGFILNQVFRSKVDFNTELCIKKILVRIMYLSSWSNISPAECLWSKRYAVTLNNVSRSSVRVILGYIKNPDDIFSPLNPIWRIFYIYKT